MMSLERIWCPVVAAQISRVTNLEGDVTSVICPDYEAETGLCRRRAAVRKGGPLSQLLERVSEGTLSDSSARCLFGGPNR